MRPAFPVRRVVFDLDGTLVDTAPDLCAAMNHVLAGVGRGAVPLEDVRHMVGQGAKKLIEQGLAATGGLDPALDFERLLALFLSHYRDNVAATSRPFDGAAALLDALAADGVALGLCTNKPQALTEALMGELDLARYFASMVGGDALAVRKPDPRHLQAVLDAMDSTGPAVLIGDTHIDVAAARSARVPVIAVSFGYSATPADALGADAVAEDFAGLERLLREGGGLGG